MLHPSQLKQLPAISRQSGVTLIELTVVVIIISILSFGLYKIFGGATEGSRARSLNLVMSQTAGALDRFKADTGCYPNRMDALWDRTIPTAANTFCGLDLRNAWREEYMKPQTTNAANNIMLDNVQQGAVLSIARQAGGNGQMWLLTAANVPNPIAQLAVSECNGTAANAAIPVAWAANLKCIGAANGAEQTDITLRFAQTL